MPKINTIKGQDPELIAIARDNPHALSLVPPKVRDRLVGKVIAVLTDSSDEQGKVIAEDETAELVAMKVHDSAYAKRRWSLCEILPDHTSLADLPLPRRR